MPDKPGDLTATEVGADFVNLAWSRPIKDGGGRLKGYIVERRESVPQVGGSGAGTGPGGWTRLTQQPILTTGLNVPHLIEDKSYEFRVIAVNDAGESEPSVIGRPVLIKDPRACAPPVLRRGLKPVTCSEGRDAVFEIDVDCSSPFDVVWSKGGRELVPSSRIEMVKENGNCQLIVHDCGIEDVEEYTARVSNRGGSKISRTELQVKSMYSSGCLAFFLLQPYR
ncbi:unnamed protein product [Protopolystoma xenopodis]|uniref:Fibronectin type-III domain-containing protein n=1 Tax=Protopolystoma xenopodis TaxID=117903 RepID=A0A3S5CBS1_9PLAT|nr:unnamed protein product [Protopolystoma xenopodis]